MDRQDEFEDSKNQTDADEVAALVAMPGWAIVKARLDATILDLQNIANIVMDDPATMQADIKARLMAVQILYGWLKNDVYGIVEQQRASQDKLVEKSNDNYIERHN